ncbi:fimbria/pilus outer membrane usher protein [Salmonella enterica]|nr:PapC/FimD family outer membrane usher protein [Salmonella enterica]EDR7365394.1 fimbria/pilus outer membrane usher protein [Salmonella enterica subsp. enterica serovar Oslo]EEN8102845.1 fimbria/pilus outer membrane usher protein [Salmonella enterica subsp. enterica serovar Give]ECH5605518.1 fimbria/pilus outer membrane usher protein [Salmonella enterica]EDA0821111.1 fimbria/pilus outer membrane usher protein [Salmonella enterica]
MFRTRLKVSRVAFLIFLSLMARESGAVEFNTDVVDAEDKGNIDFTAFSRAGYIMPGIYQMQISLNGDGVGNEMSVPFFVRSSAGEKDPLPEACLPLSLVDKLGLKEASRQKVGTWHQGQCADFRALPGVQITPDLSRSRVNLNIPQAWLEYSDASWLPPSRWDNGIPGLLLDYNASGTVTKNRGQSQQQYASVNGTAGLNAGAWRLRADYQGNYSHITGSRQPSQQRFDLSRLYLYRPLPQMQAKLTLGENYVNSSLFDSWRYTGGVLESDENMLPPQLRGYAPEIIGVAKTNARVTVTQQGRVLYDSTVPAGPFRIQSLSNATRGQLDVKVTEQNGEVQTFTVNTASVPYLTRPGRVRYQVIVGRPSDWDHNVNGDMFTAGEMSWGISNAWSAYGGGILSRGYKSFALGLGRDLMRFGTVAFDVTQSFARLSGADIPGMDDRQGKSYRVSYSKRFDEINADVTFAGYRFTERDFMSMQDYLSAINNGMLPERQKERYQVNLNKRFDDIGLPFSVGLNYEHQTYWDRGDTEQYGMNVGTWFDLPSLGLRNLSLNLTASRSQYYGKNDDAVNLMLSVPVGRDTASLSGAYSGGRYSERLGYYGRVGQLDSYSLNAGMNHGGDQDSNASFNGMYTHNGALAQVGANMAVEGNRYSSFGLSINGGLTATAKGAALHAGGYNGGTRLMVDTDGVGGVPVDGGRTVTNPWGIGVLTDVSSYYRTTARVDVNNLPDDVQATQGVAEAALTEGAIGYRKFSVLKGRSLFAVLRLADGTHPPFGASVRNQQGRELGIVSDGGLAWLSGLSAGEALNVTWNGRTGCRVRIPERVGDAQLLLPCTGGAGE